MLRNLPRWQRRQSSLQWAQWCNRQPDLTASRERLCGLTFSCSHVGFMRCLVFCSIILQEAQSTVQWHAELRSHLLSVWLHFCWINRVWVMQWSLFSNCGTNFWFWTLTLHCENRSASAGLISCQTNYSNFSWLTCRRLSLLDADRLAVEMIGFGCVWLVVDDSFPLCWQHRAADLKWQAHSIFTLLILIKMSLSPLLSVLPCCSSCPPSASASTSFSSGLDTKGKKTHF